MVHIVGVAHPAQTKRVGAEESDAQKEFRACISKAIEQIKPALIAEELSEYALKRVTKEKGTEQESVTKSVADSCRIEHRFCDPDAEARKRIGYVEGGQLALTIAMSNNDLTNEEINSRGFAMEVAKYWPLREQFWMDQLRDVLNKDFIFVCGDAHIETLQELLGRMGIESTVVQRHIGVTQRDDDFGGRVMAYLEAHPELR